MKNAGLSFGLQRETGGDPVGFEYFIPMSGNKSLCWKKVQLS